MPAGHDTLLLSVLTTAYGSAPLARVAVDGALADAGLADLPSSRHELASFVGTDLRAITEADLGSVIADALTVELLALVDGPERQEPAPSSVRRPLGHVSVRSTMRAIPRQPQSASEVEQPISQLRRRKAASIMLVRVDHADEAMGLDWNAFADCVLKVRHPLPACERMRVMRPPVVIVGSTVGGRDVERLIHAAREIGCDLLELGAFVARAALHEALRRAVARASSRRADRPGSARASDRGAAGGEP